MRRNILKFARRDLVSQESVTAGVQTGRQQNVRQKAT